MASVFNNLIIENFGPIIKANIEVKDMMVFIGPQASGKSTLAKLITILEDVNFKENTKSSLYEELEKYNISSFLKENTYIKYQTPSFKYIFKNNSEDKFDIYDILNKIDDSESNQLSFISRAIGVMLMSIDLDEKTNILFREIQKHENYGLNSKIESIFNNYKSIATEITEKIFKIYSKDVKDKKEYLILLDIVKKVFSLIRPLDSLYIPAERTLLPLLAPNIGGLINNDIQIPKNILTTIQQFEKAIQKIDEIDLNVIGALKFKQLEGRSFIYHNKTDRTLFKDASSGIQSFLPLVLLIENSLKDNYINLNYVVEEPELNLYPEAQYKLIKYLVKNCLETTREIKTKNLIITTHSPYVLASINNLLLAYNKGKVNRSKTIKLVEECSWIDSNHFNAYEVKKGTVKRIFNKRSKLIEDNIMDEVSEKIMYDFKSLAIINDKSN